VKRSLIIAGVLVITLLLLAGFYIRAAFVFNPLTFTKDEITDLPWTWYKQPVVFELVMRDPKEVRRISDEAQVRHVIDEFRKGLRSGALEDSCANTESGRPFDLLLQSQTATLLQVKGCENDDVVALQTNDGDVPIALSSNLKAILQDWRSEETLPSLP